ncbi:unnamed protein product [Darwinula stevensoni]|uniref:Uncharacterized protein n=1 Tax=Darwinula stevensoni TaxID=69355 RepID=A0A7R8X973_9CRUS|nr:unnamed protein product [Darwinula stevensoni]CAG0889407.1 unnamed protein product [Darwinula stevensoni]
MQLKLKKILVRHTCLKSKSVTNLAEASADPPIDGTPPQVTAASLPLPPVDIPPPAPAADTEEAGAAGGPSDPLERYPANIPIPPEES